MEIEHGPTAIGRRNLNRIDQMKTPEVYTIHIPPHQQRMLGALATAENKSMEDVLCEIMMAEHRRRHRHKLIFRALIAIPIAFIVAGLFTGCTVIHGNRNKGSYTYATLGGDANGYAQTPDGVTAEAVKTSDGFRDFNKTIRAGIIADAAKSITDSLAGAATSINKANKVADVKKFRAGEATKQAEIEAATRETEILNPVEEAPVE